ncbi:hypothetical protein AVEN_244191-1 [Araneus ventricosus]|uniref:Uncharacterized protein n=1 Tax=Araneus ventricosus TaxID=182803 RepID=A0A4Y2R160_ARAVE|nr:hypothetical protein AVEN_244191-1 [Araneus ventricosus]
MVGFREFREGWMGSVAPMRNDGEGFANSHCFRVNVRRSRIFFPKFIRIGEVTSFLNFNPGRCGYWMEGRDQPSYPGLFATSGVRTMLS